MQAIELAKIPVGRTDEISGALIGAKATLAAVCQRLGTAHNYGPMLIDSTIENGSFYIYLIIGEWVGSARFPDESEFRSLSKAFPNKPDPYCVNCGEPVAKRGTRCDACEANFFTEV